MCCCILKYHIFFEKSTTVLKIFQKLLKKVLTTDIYYANMCLVRVQNIKKYIYRVHMKEGKENEADKSTAKSV